MGNGPFLLATHRAVNYALRARHLVVVMMMMMMRND